MAHPSSSATQGSGRMLSREHSGSSLKRSVQAVFEGERISSCFSGCRPSPRMYCVLVDRGASPTHNHAPSPSRLPPTHPPTHTIYILIYTHTYTCIYTLPTFTLDPFSPSTRVACQVRLGQWPLALCPLPSPSASSFDVPPLVAGLLVAFTQRGRESLP